MEALSTEEYDNPFGRSFFAYCSKAKRDLIANPCYNGYGVAIALSIQVLLDYTLNTISLFKYNIPVFEKCISLASKSSKTSIEAREQEEEEEEEEPPEDNRRYHLIPRTRNAFRLHADDDGNLSLVHADKTSSTFISEIGPLDYEAMIYLDDQDRKLVAFDTSERHGFSRLRLVPRNLILGRSHEIILVQKDQTTVAVAPLMEELVYLPIVCSLDKGERIFLKKVPMENGQNINSNPNDNFLTNENLVADINGATNEEGDPEVVGGAGASTCEPINVDFVEVPWNS